MIKKTITYAEMPLGFMPVGLGRLGFGKMLLTMFYLIR